MPRIGPFEKHSDKYEKWFIDNEYAYQSEVNAIKDIIPDFKDGIEIGVGSGKFAGPLGIGLGIEPSVKMGKIAMARGIEVKRCAAEKLPFDDCSFDLVLMVTTLCFLDDTDRAFSEVYRILRHGGFFINGFVDKNSRVGKIYQENKDKSVFYGEADFYSTEETVKILKKAGFRKFEFRQTIFNTLDKIDKIEKVEPGYGEGSFVVIKAVKY